ncbi:DUF402 domain-containing protein [Deinococcus fonticola]|uniref:DUF402 domain-containing protein n=1 Tax=Deinococcus fonticola TaxID=2528713 RepID=UPI001074A43F|nr:DUF402 domain-containing protein [Deinococcus fonticola]
MKLKRAGRKGWPRVVSDEELVLHVPGGVMVDYVAGEVVRPLDVEFRGRTLRILDSGYRWLHFAPVSANHAVTVQLDQHLEPVQIYVDICDGHGIDPDGVPFTHDLYLDVLAVCEVQADGTWHVTATEIIDLAELDEALTAGKITPTQFELAWAEAKGVEGQLNANAFPALDVIRAYLRDQRGLNSPP